MITVRIVYPTDPMSIVPGGLDSMIKDIIGNVPSHLRMQLVGVTTDRVERPLNTWTKCKLGEIEFDFFPVTYQKDLTKQHRTPLVVRFMLGMIGKDIYKGADVIQFHRMEPLLLYRNVRASKTCILHQTMRIIKHSGSDIRWSYFPKLYFFIEKFILSGLDLLECVRESAIEYYCQRLGSKINEIRFLPTWYDDNLFNLANRSKLDDRLNLVFVGRLDEQKNPHLLLDAFNMMVNVQNDLHLTIVGDGILEKELRQEVSDYGLENNVTFTGAIDRADIAHLLNMSDLFLLTSNYEGMPICVLESLASGVPVVSTKVGEVPRILDGLNGVVVNESEAQEISSAALDILGKIDSSLREYCANSVNQYSSTNGLSSIYKDFTNLGKLAWHIY